MTEQQHPITPPPELVQQWSNDWHRAKVKHVGCAEYIATQAARWGADQELEACREWASQFNYDDYRYQDELRAARRPKPPSLAEQGLAALERQAVRSVPSLAATNDCEAIRCALERLQQLEQENND